MKFGTDVAREYNFPSFLCCGRQMEFSIKVIVKTKTDWPFVII